MYCVFAKFMCSLKEYVGIRYLVVSFLFGYDSLLFRRLTILNALLQAATKVFKNVWLPK